MHPYYEKSEKSLRRNLHNFMVLIKPELEKSFNETYVELFEEIWQIYYYRIVDKMPYIGGKKSSGTTNLLGAFCFIAMGEAGKKHNMTLEEWGYLTTECYKRFYLRFPTLFLKIAKKAFMNEKLMYHIFKKRDEKNKKNSSLWPKGFITEVQKPSCGFHFMYNINQCPLDIFAREMGFEEYMPYICNLDYVGFSSMGIHFERTKTCASGDGCCNFCFSKKDSVTPFWPCHGLNDKSPLK